MRLLAPLTEAAAQQTPAPDIFTVMLPALIGFTGVIIGGFLQVVAKHRADRYTHMVELRRDVAALISKVSGFAAVIVQSSTWIDGVRDDLMAKMSDDPDAEVEGDDDYNERLAEAMMSGYRESAQMSASLLVASDKRIADHVGDLQLKLAAAINEVGYMHTGRVHIPEARAKELQGDLLESVNVLINMVAPRKTEAFLTFRSAKTAKKLLDKERAKAKLKGYAVE